MIASDLEKMKEDAKFLDVAELRTTILRDAAQNFIMSQPDDTQSEPESNATQGTIDVNATEPVYTVSEEDTSVLPEQDNQGSVPTPPDAPINTVANWGQPAA